MLRDGIFIKIVTSHYRNLKNIAKNAAIFDVVLDPWPLVWFILYESLHQDLKLLEFTGNFIIGTNPMRVGFPELKGPLILPVEELP